MTPLGLLITGDQASMNGTVTLAPLAGARIGGAGGGAAAALPAAIIPTARTKTAASFCSPALAEPIKG